MGFADMEGNVVIPMVYFFVRPFSNGFSAFNVGGWMEKEGDLENHIRIFGGKWGFINKQGIEVFPAIFDHVSDFNDKEALVKIGNYEFYLKLN